MHSGNVVVEFCKLCNSAYEAATFRRFLFDDNPLKIKLQKSFANEALSKLSEITQEHALLQIAKLHDPEQVACKTTLGIDFIIKQGNWDEEDLKELKKLKSILDKLAKKLRKCRNKTLSHNDIDSIMCGDVLGKFEQDEEVAYFSTLQEFVNFVYNRTLGGEYLFNDLVKNDAIAFNSFLEKSLS